MTSVGTLAAFAIVCLSVIWLRRTHPEIPRGYRVPFYPVVPILGIASCLWLITTVPNYVLIIFAWYTAGDDRALLRLRDAQFASSPRATTVMADDETPDLPGGRAARARTASRHPALSAAAMQDWKGRLRPPFSLAEPLRRPAP